MHLITPAPIATEPLPGNGPIQHGACGSDARLAVLLYLAHRPSGASIATLAELTGLDEPTTRQVIRQLSNDDRVACDQRGKDSTWYVPNSRAGLSHAKLNRLPGDAL